jgi:type VI secretion system protein
MITGSNTFWRRAVAALVPVMLAAVFAGCPAERNFKLNVQVAANANGGSPIALDLLLVSNKDLLKELQKMSAAEWFERREQIIRDYKQGEFVIARRWEFVPGQAVSPDNLKVGSGVKGAVIFANYFKPGEHRAVINSRRDVLIRLGEDKFEVVQGKR